MDNFNYKKFLSEGKLLKEEQMGSYGKFLKVVKSYEDEEILSDFLDSYPKGQDISKSEYDKFTEKHLGLADPEDHRGENWKYIMSESVIKEEVDVLGDEFTQEIQDDMKMYYKMDVDMDAIKDWINMYYIGYNSEYDDGPGDVDYEGNEFGSEDYESEKKELVFDTAEREDFYMHLNPEADSTFPNLSEGRLHENSPGFEGRKYGESLPTLKSIQSAYESKQISEEEEVAKAPKKEVKKPKKDSVDNKLAEIDKEGQIVALEAKIEAIDEMIESKNQRISMVTEDDNLSQLVDKKKMKEMQREVKDLERRKAKMEKLYEKMCGKSYTKEEIVDEEMSTELNEDSTTTKLKERIKKTMLSEDTNNDLIGLDSMVDTPWGIGRAYEFVKGENRGGDYVKIVFNDDSTQDMNRAEFDEEEYEPGIWEEYINEGKTTMKKSELKEMIKKAMLSEDPITITNTTDAYDPLYEEDVEENMSQSMGSSAAGGAAELERMGKELYSKVKDGAISLNDFLEKMASALAPGFSASVSEAEDVEVEDDEEVDVDIEKDVEIDDESVESDIEVDASMPGESADEVAVQSLLMKAQEEAAKLGDEKLTDQIGNTITYFTRAHVAQVDENKRLKRSKARKSLKESKVRRGEDGLITKLL